MYEAIGAVVVAIVTALSTLGSVWLKNRLAEKSEKKKRMLVQKKQVAFWERDAEIQKKLSAIRHQFQADRVYVTLLHNGDTFVTGRSFEKMSMVYEDREPILPPLLNKVQNWSTAPFALLLHDLQAKTRYHRTAREEGKASRPYDTHTMRQYEIQDEYMFAITDDYGVMVGILGLHYIDETKDLAPERIERLAWYAARLFPYLENWKPIVKLADVDDYRNKTQSLEDTYSVVGN